MTGEIKTNDVGALKHALQQSRDRRDELNEIVVWLVENYVMKHD